MAVDRAEEFRAVMAGDATLMGILTGGVYTRATAGHEGISRATTPSAFDANGFLKPCALVVARARVPDGGILDEGTDDGRYVHSVRQTVAVYIYADGVGYSTTDSAADRVSALFNGRKLSNSALVRLTNALLREQELGSAIRGAAMAKLEFLVIDTEEITKV